MSELVRAVISDPPNVRGLYRPLTLGTWLIIFALLFPSTPIDNVFVVPELIVIDAPIPVGVVMDKGVVMGGVV